MVIDCQVCGAQQRIDDDRVAATGGTVTCRSCGATIKLGMSARDDDDMPTLVGGPPKPRPRPAPAPIPLAGSEGLGVPVPDFDLDSLAVGSALPPAPEPSVFTDKTSPVIRRPPMKSQEEPIPLLDGEDLLEAAEDAETIPGVALSDIARPAPASSPGGFNFATPVPLPSAAPIPAPMPAPRPPMAAPRPPGSPNASPPMPIAPAPVAASKTPSFLEELPAFNPNQVAHDAPTRFNRNFNADDLPGIGDRTAPGAPAFTAPPAPAFTAPPPAPAMELPPPDASFDLPPPPAFASAEADLPAAYEAPSDLPAPADMSQWAAVDSAQVSHTPPPPVLDFESDLPSPAASPDLDLPASYTGTPYTSSGYEEASFDSKAPELAQPPSDFGDLSPLEGMDGLPSDLPPLPQDLGDDLPPPPPVPSEPAGIELDSDLPTPSAYGGGMAMESGVVLSDDLPTPSVGDGGNDMIGLDLPTPRADEMGPDDSVPQLMDTPVLETVPTPPPPPVQGGDDTVVVRDKRKKPDAVDLDAVPKKSRAPLIGAVAALVLAAFGFVTYQFPDALGIRMPWAKDAGTTVADNGGGPDAVPAKADGKQKDPSAATAAKEPPPAALVEERPAAVIPELTAANVNQLDYPALREATQLLVASGKAANGAGKEVVQWARFRMAQSYGDTKARDELLADAPVMSPQASEFAAATAVGINLLQNKPGLAKKNAERLVGPGPGPGNKARFKDSVAMLTVLGAATDKPPIKAIQIYDRALAIDPKAIDARVGKIVASLTIPKPQQRTQALGQAVALLKSEPSAALAVKLGRAAIAADGASAMTDLAAPLAKLEQANDLPASMGPAFLRLLAHRAAIAGNFALAKRAAEQVHAAAPEDPVATMNLARLTAAGGGDPTAVLTETRTRIRDVEGKAALIDEQVKLELSRRDVAGARKALALASDLAPRPAMPFVKLGEARIALAEGKNELAVKNANLAAKARPKTFEARLVAIAAGKLPAPAELAQLTALAKAANNADVDARLGKTMAERANHGGAAELYARALWRDPIVTDPVATALAMADAFDRSGNAEGAESVLAALRANVPDDERLGAAMLAHAKRHGKGALAVDYFQSASDKNPKDVGLKLQLARAMVEAGRASEAQAILDGVAHTPEGAQSPDVLRELARAWVTRDTVKARTYATDSIRLKPDAQAYALLGEIEEANSKLDDAMDAYRKAIKLDSGFIEARVRLARAQVQRGQWQDAATQLRDIVQHDPTNVQAMELLGDAMRDIGKPREALLWYKKALDVTPDSAMLMMKFARLQLQDLAAVQPAVKSFRQILQVHPDLAEAHYYLGYALKDLGRTGEAKSELEQYLKARPDGEFAAEVKNDLQDLASQ